MERLDTHSNCSVKCCTFYLQIDSCMCNPIEFVIKPLSDYIDINKTEL